MRRRQGGGTRKKKLKRKSGTSTGVTVIVDVESNVLPAMVSTLETSHAETSPLNVHGSLILSYAIISKSSMFVISLVSHSLISPYVAFTFSLCADSSLAAEY